MALAHFVGRAHEAVDGGAGQGGDAGCDIIDRHEVQCRAGRGGQRADLAVRQQLEQIGDGAKPPPPIKFVVAVLATRMPLCRLGAVGLPI